MERLCKEDRKELVWAMRKSLMEQVGSAVLTESASVSAKNFILNEATYEQMLNLCFNPNREEKYLPASVLEQVAVKTYEKYVAEAFDKSKLDEKVAKEAAEAKAAILKSKAAKMKEKASEFAKSAKEKASKLATSAKNTAVKGSKAIWATKSGKAATVAVPTLAVGSIVAKKLHDRQKAKKSA
jgi:hypothetical protein